MKRTNTSRIAFVTLITLAAAPALAEDPAIPSQGPVPFDSFDADGSGYVNQNEFDMMRSERVRLRAEENRQYRYMGDAPEFTDIDADRDGRLDRTEVNAHQRKRHENRNQHRVENRERNRMGGMGNGPGMGGGSGGKSHGGGMGGRK